jgi:hypothetical protein
MLTSQQLFDKVATHLFTQGRPAKKSYNNSATPACAYRGNDGTKCAAGCVMPDEAYTPDVEGASINTFKEHGRLEGQFGEFFPEVDPKDMDLLGSLQIAHDNDESEGDGGFFIESKLRSHLLEIALHYDLDAGVLDGLSIQKEG